ncbi:MAG: hypothetical protein KatS3mg035_0793 [Bacteroidia bacterium]|nr:MAG: hypothetical protein KatS3mg035_0793 [Bacteroidia bacterium]
MEFKEQLWLDLYKSYQEARRHKGKKWEVVEFEIDVEKNLYDLYESLYKMTYEPLPTKVFIVEKTRLKEKYLQPSSETE